MGVKASKEKGGLQSEIEAHTIIKIIAVQMKTNYQILIAGRKALLIIKVIHNLNLKDKILNYFLKTRLYQQIY